MKLIVGLGNPGTKYEKTRHNSGFIAIDFFAHNHNLSFKEKNNGLYAETKINEEKIILLKPQKYMNLSGEVVKSYKDYFNIDNSDILVIYDDINYEVGGYKIRRDGSSGGHNGIDNIIKNLGTNQIQRLKIGISKNNIALEKYVLSKFSKEEIDKLQSILPKIENIIIDFAKINIDELMSKYNKRETL